MTSTLTPRRTRPATLSVPAARRWAFAGAWWAFAFTAVHGYWAAGGRLGVPTATAPIADRPAFLAYDIVAAVVLFGAGAVGLLLSTPLGGGRSRLFLVQLALVGAVAALVRGGLGLLEDFTTAATGGAVTAVGVLCDGWFLVAGGVFLAVAVRLRPTARVVSGLRR